MPRPASEIGWAQATDTATSAVSPVALSRIFGDGNIDWQAHASTYLGQPCSGSCFTSRSVASVVAGIGSVSMLSN